MFHVELLSTIHFIRYDLSHNKKLIDVDNFFILICTNLKIDCDKSMVMDIIKLY